MKKLTTLLLVVMIISPSILFAQYTNALRVKISGNGYSDETVIRFINGATPNFDGAYDAWKLFSTNPNVPSIFSKTSENENLAINSLPNYNKDTSIQIHTIVPVTGIYSIEVEEIFPVEDDYVLSFTVLSDNAVYTISGNQTFNCSLNSNSSNHPSLMFNVSKQFSTNVIAIENTNFYKLLNKSNGSFELVFNNNEEKNIVIYDLTGKIVDQEQTFQPNYSIDLSRYSIGLYIININSGNQFFSEKVFR